MTPELIILGLVVVTALAFDFTNGFHDTGNAMATSIATGALRPKVAVGLSAVLNLVGAFHGSELEYLFDDDQLPGPRTPAQHDLANRMIGYWTDFARNGTPSGAVHQWPSYGGNGLIQQLRPGVDGTVDIVAEHQCAFWKAIPY